MINDLKELYQYREMIRSLVYKELRAKYKGSVLGFFWSLLIPLFQLLIYTIVFSVFLNSGIENYSMYLFVALIPWIFFNSCITTGSLSIIQQKNLVEKIYFPRMVLPVAVAISCFINMLLSFIVVFLALFITKIGVRLEILWFLLIVFVIEFLMGIGASLLFSALTVYFRDLEYILNIITMAWMYMTPVLYSLDIIPESVRGYLYFNPMTSVIIAYRDILYYQQLPELQTLCYAAAWGVVTLFVGWFVFKKLQKRFVEEL